MSGAVGSVEWMLTEGKGQRQPLGQPIDTRTFQQYDRNNATARQQVLNARDSVAPIFRNVDRSALQDVLQGKAPMPTDAEQRQMVQAAMGVIPMAGMAMPMNKALPAEAQKVFGTTLNPRQAGYITHDGKMLDFSGKHYGDPGPNPTRNVDHRELSGESRYTDWNEFDLAPNAGGGTEGMFDFMNQSGAVRWMPEANSASFTAPPTREQAERLMKAYNETKRYNGQETLMLGADHPQTMRQVGSIDMDRPNVEKIMKWANETFPEDLRGLLSE